MRVALAVLALGSFAGGQSTTRESVASGGAEANNYSARGALSGDGRFVAFESVASNLVAGDTNAGMDVFVRDRSNGATELVSISTSGLQGNLGSYTPAISADGRYVAFESLASNLVQGDLNNTWDVFLRDRQNGTTIRISVSTAGAEGNLESHSPSVSADGRYVAFASVASNLSASDSNGSQDIFVRDCVNGTTERVSVSSGGTQANSSSYFPAISADGVFVGYESIASNLVAGDTNGFQDVFIYDRQWGVTERVSVGATGSEGNSASGAASVSGDGRFVAFFSVSSNLVSSDTNGIYDVFVRDRIGGTTERASVDSHGAEGNDGSLFSSISTDGRFVAFYSQASNLVAGDMNLRRDAFVRDRVAGTTERVSVSTSWLESNSDSYEPQISADGRFVAFYSDASNLIGGDTNAVTDVFVRDRLFPPPPPPSPFCLGDATAGLCPCGNSGQVGKGCENSASTGGAVLVATGTPSLAGDTLVLTASGELPTVLSIVLQGTAAVAAVNFGDGLRCAGGALKRLYMRSASAGTVTAPMPGDPTISMRSATLGDVLTAGSPRYYQVYYRDPVLTFCPSPPGNSWNISSGVFVTWSP